MISKSCPYNRNFRYSPTTVYFTDDGNLLICSDIPILVDADSLIRKYCLISLHGWISLFCLISVVLSAFMFIFIMKHWYSIVLFLYLSLWLCNLFSKQALRFFQMVWWSLWLRKIFRAVLCPTHLFQWKLICSFNQHCLSFKFSNRLQFNSSLFFWKLFETVLHWHYFFQDVPHIQKTLKYIN